MDPTHGLRLGRNVTPSEKLDLYKLHQDEYITPKKPQLVKTNRETSYHYWQRDRDGHGGD